MKGDRQVSKEKLSEGDIVATVQYMSIPSAFDLH